MIQPRDLMTSSHIVEEVADDHPCQRCHCLCHRPGARRRLLYRQARLRGPPRRPDVGDGPLARGVAEGPARSPHRPLQGRGPVSGPCWWLSAVRLRQPRRQRHLPGAERPRRGVHRAAEAGALGHVGAVQGPRRQRVRPLRGASPVAALERGEGSASEAPVNGPRTPPPASQKDLERIAGIRPAKAPRRRRPLPMRNAYDTVYISYGSRRTLGGLAIILVTGATGTVGRPLVELLAAEGAGVRAVTRDPKAAGLPAGVEVVEGDPSRPGTIAPFLEGATGLFVNPRSVGSGISELLGLAQERGVKRVTSSTGRTRPSPNRPSTSGTWPRRAPARCSPAWWRRSSAAPHAPTPSGSPTTPRPSGAEGRPARQAQRAERRAARRVTIGAWTAPGSTAGCGRCGW